MRKELYKNISLLGKQIGGKVLDIGCGSKPYQKLFTNTKEYMGMEFNSPENRKRSSADIFYDSKHFPFENETFNSVIFTQVLEHIFNPDEFLSEVKRVLKKMVVYFLLRHLYGTSMSNRTIMPATLRLA